jgi:HD-GYP domain-containing protein (c-di-GMP phosphodiesterase class II)
MVQQHRLDRMIRLEIETGQMEVAFLHALLDISQAMTSELELPRLLAVVTEKVRSLLKADRCSVFLLDEKTHELCTMVADGLGGREIRLPADMGLVGHVAGTGKTLNVKDAYDNTLFDRAVDQKTGYRTRTILSMPLKNRIGKVIGVFQVLNKAQGVFTQEDERMLEGVTGSAAIAIENAQLYQAQRKSFDKFLNVLSLAIDERNPVNNGHTRRVIQYAQLLATALGWDVHRKKMLMFACNLHDFWNIEVLDEFFIQSGYLTPEEFEELSATVTTAKRTIHQHAFSDQLQKVLRLPEYRFAVKFHESGEYKKSPAAELVVLADLCDMLTYEEPYKPRMPITTVLEVLRDELRDEVPRHLLEHFLDLGLDTVLKVIVLGSPYRIKYKDLEYFATFTLRQYLEVAGHRGKRKKEDQDLVDLFASYYTL